MPLTDLDCRTAKPKDKPYKLSDGNGLQLWVAVAGSRNWRFAYRRDGKQRSVLLGAYPTVGLGEARRKRDQARREMWEGRDPADMVAEQKTEPADRNFRTVALAWFDTVKGGWKPAHAERVWSRMKRDALSEIGEMALDDIEPRHVIDLIRKIESRGALDISRRIRQSIGQVFRYAIVEGWVRSNPASSDINVVLKPKPKVRHFAALKENELPGFFRQLATYDGERRTTIALLVTIQTMVRTKEIRFARWSEISNLDGKAPLWRIPADRMKMEREHVIPLARQTVALLKELRGLTGSYEHLFPAPTKKGVMSENTMLYAMYRMGYHSRATVHGFRTTASTVLNENGWDENWIERQLAHDDDDEVRASYNAAEYLDGRREMVQWWCDRLDDHREGRKVTWRRVS